MSEKFDRFRVPRIVANAAGIQVVTDPKSPVIAAGSCQLGPVDPARTEDPAYLQELVAAAAENNCVDGLYVVEGRLFRLKDGQAQEILKTP